MSPTTTTVAPVSGSKKCPHCSKTISANKEMCWSAILEYGTLESWNIAKAEIEANAVIQETQKPKRVRKPRTSKKKEEPEATI